MLYLNAAYYALFAKNGTTHDPCGAEGNKQQTKHTSFGYYFMFSGWWEHRATEKSNVHSPLTRKQQWHKYLPVLWRTRLEWSSWFKTSQAVQYLQLHLCIKWHRREQNILGCSFLKTHRKPYTEEVRHLYLFPADLIWNSWGTIPGKEN